MVLEPPKEGFRVGTSGSPVPPLEVFLSQGVRVIWK